MPVIRQPMGYSPYGSDDPQRLCHQKWRSGRLRLKFSRITCACRTASFVQAALCRSVFPQPGQHLWNLYPWGENGQPNSLGGSHGILVTLIDSLTIRLHHLTSTGAGCFPPLSVWGSTFTGASILVCGLLVGRSLASLFRRSCGAASVPFEEPAIRCRRGRRMRCMICDQV